MCTANDPFITYLKQFGYSAIRLPRTNIAPLQVLGKYDRDLSWLGDVTELFVPSPAAQLPNISRDMPVAEISGKRSGELSVGVGVSILKGIIEALAGSKLGINLAFRNAKSITFEFPEVFSDHVSPLALDKFLAQSDVDPNAVSVGRMLEADKLYLITSTLKASTFVVDAKAETGASVAVDVPAINGAISGNVTVDGDSASAGKVAFTGTTPVIFGFQAVQLFYDKGRYTAIKPLPPGHIVARATEVTRSSIDEKLERFETDATFARVDLGG